MNPVLSLLSSNNFKSHSCSVSNIKALLSRLFKSASGPKGHSSRKFSAKASLLCRLKPLAIRIPIAKAAAGEPENRQQHNTTLFAAEARTYSFHP
jgi:hypothetical protein